MHPYAHFLALSIARLSHLSYPDIFLAILASGHPIPVPEGVIFFVLGILAHRGLHTLLGVMAVAALACFVYDLVLYSLAYAGSRLLAALDKHVERWGHWYSGRKDHEMLFLTFVSHFVPGWRMANPVIAAGLGVPPRRFILYSILPALIYPALYILAGYALIRL